MRLKNAGLTYIEILTVVALIVILAGMAVPNAITHRNKALCVEAVTNLAATRDSLIRYLTLNGTYDVGGDLTQLDYDPNNPGGGQMPKFTYALTSAATTFTLTATGNGGTPVSGKTVTLDQAGALGGTL